MYKKTLFTRNRVTNNRLKSCTGTTVTGPVTGGGILGLLVNSQITGNGIKRLSQLKHVSPSTIEFMDSKNSLEGVPSLLADIDDQSCFHEYRESDVLYRNAKELYLKMVNFEARRNHDRNEDTPYNKYARIVMQYGGPEILMRIIMMNSLFVKSSQCQADTERELRIKSVCLEIMSRFISVKPEGEKLAKELSETTDSLSYIFSLLAYDKTCHTACQFIEDLLQSRRGVLGLSTVANLQELVDVMDDRKLANFCRILAITISDLDIYENKSSLYAQNKQKRTKGFVNLRDLNQEQLLNIPDLLSRLVDIACSKYSGHGGSLLETPRYHGMTTELDNWMEWIDNQMSEDAFDPPTMDDLETFIGGISEPASLNGPFVAQSGLHISLDLILRVQVVYVLGLFLVGKHRKKVQRKLAELNLVPGLSEMFDQFIWKCQSSQRQHHYHSNRRQCECSPEVALKIQFLRLVHSFCDHSDFKHLLLSKSELNEIKRINAKADLCLQIDNIDTVNRQLMCKGNKGLLTKIVEVMKKEPTASTFRFWLARAVESYLRGSTSYCDQVFLLRRGLLQHIAGNIVDHDIRPKEILQSSFDLLGELCKFNVEAFRNFDKVLSTDERCEKFLEVVNRNLVDSNMFIRSLVLSYEHFNSAQTEYKDYSNSESRLLKHVSSLDMQLNYLQKLINVINVETLTQENVSCLNTTLVFLMFANRKSQIPQYLQGLMTNMSPRGECITDSQILKNFRDLLVFWQDHYLHKDKDCSALEKSSRIDFDFWKNTVNILVSDNRELSTSILHYVEPDFERDS